MKEAVIWRDARSLPAVVGGVPDSETRTGQSPSLQPNENQNQ